MNDTPRSPFRFYLALGLFTGATLALEIIQTRILSVVSWYHLAFFVISVAMFGMTLGALLVFLRPALFGASLEKSLARFAFYAALSTGLAYLDQLCLAPEMVFSASALIVFARLALTVSVPFFFSGVVVTLALTRSPYPIGRTYGADLVGASLGCLTVIPLLSQLDGPGAIFAAGAMMAAAACLFAERNDRRGAAVVAALWILLALGNAVTIRGLDPIVVKGVVEKRHGIDLERWNSFSRIIAYNAKTAEPKTVMWAASNKTPTDPIDVITMNIDGQAGTYVYNMAGDLSRVAFLTYDVTSLAHSLRGGSVAVIGVGGGRDVMTALVTGHTDVLGIELNPAFTDALRGPYREFAGLVDFPGVRLVTDEARSYLTRDTGRYDIIQASLIDTWAATGAGAFTLSENSIYTVEAWQVFLRRLAPRGIFTVSRWYAPERMDETARLVSLALGTLYANGVAEPRCHVMLAAHGQVATILVSNDPFSENDVAALRARCDDLGFTLILAPGAPVENSVLASIVEAKSFGDLQRLGESTALDLTPPTDSRPFFFNLIRLSRPWEVFGYIRRPSGVVTGNLIATVTLLTILVVTILLAAATIAIPARFSPPGASRPGAAALAYFAIIGLGFMLSEIAFLQRLSVYLGHPVYSLAVVLFSLILFTGIGSFISEAFPLNTRPRLYGFYVLLPGYLIAAAVLLPYATEHFQAFGLAGRSLLCVVLLAPAGLLMGQAFPAGMRLAKERARLAGDVTDPTPWLWGVNGAAGVVASAAAIAISITFGITATMLAGAACYAANLLAVRALMVR